MPVKRSQLHPDKHYTMIQKLVDKKDTALYFMGFAVELPPNVGDVGVQIEIAPAITDHQQFNSNVFILYNVLNVLDRILIQGVTQCKNS
jgi:hypothetical protein